MVQPLISTENKHHRPIIFLDYDDTLLPSSALQAALQAKGPHGSQMTALLKAQLERHQTRVIEFLQVCKKYGDTCVVTNGENGWVEQSCSRFMPDVVAELKPLPIFSARHFFENKDPQNPMLWKLHAFTHLLSVATPAPRQVISLGDSNVEREAIRRACSSMSASCCLKIIKLVEYPSISQLSHELEILANAMPEIVTQPGGCDQELKVEPPFVAASSACSTTEEKTCELTKASDVESSYGKNFRT
jgi:hypothetical protein